MRMIVMMVKMHRAEMNWPYFLAACSSWALANIIRVVGTASVWILKTASWPTLAGT